ncbi:hypothetical protein BGP83_09045 [Pseudomonas putida]|nr:hypothetical protein BGP83_09045 [Pseudomonas putida]
MQMSAVEFTDEIKILVEQDGEVESIRVIYGGEHGHETAGAVVGNVTLQDAIEMANSIVDSPGSMARLRGNQHLARLIYTLFIEQGISRTAQQIHNLGLLIRTRHAGITAQSTPDSLPFPYERPSTPLSELKYSAAGNRNHFQLTPSDDEIAFLLPESPGYRWNDKQSLGPVLRDFAVKRLFEIYRADQTRGHLAWVAELGFAGDLGL